MIIDFEALDNLRAIYNSRELATLHWESKDEYDVGDRVMVWVDPRRHQHPEPDRLPLPFPTTIRGKMEVKVYSERLKRDAPKFKYLFMQDEVVHASAWAELMTLAYCSREYHPYPASTSLRMAHLGAKLSKQS